MSKFIFKELIDFLKKRKKWWIIPLIIVLMLIIILFIFRDSTVGTFNYSLF